MCFAAAPSGGQATASNIDGAAGSVVEIARIVSQIRRRWPRVRILLRADSGFCRDELMVWCEAHDVDYLFALACNDRLTAQIAEELAEACDESQQTGKPARRFKDFTWRTLKSWGRSRRVVAKAEWTRGEANPRFVVTSLSARQVTPLGVIAQTWPFMTSVTYMMPSESEARSSSRARIGPMPSSTVDTQPMSTSTALIRLPKACAMNKLPSGARRRPLATKS
jgi:hypothetical protein